MRIRSIIITAAAAVTVLASCGPRLSGPIVISAIGGTPRLIDPNLRPFDPPSAMLALATAQGLVRFDQSGQVEPALAQSWIVSDDGLRYTFRIARVEWQGGQAVTAEQVVARLRAATQRTSRNDLKIALGAIERIQAMTDDVLEIGLKGPRPNFLQLLAQPELAIVRGSTGSGPYRGQRQPDGSWQLTIDSGDDDGDLARPPPIVLRGESAAKAVARFSNRLADFVTGGTVGDLPIARVADLPANTLRFNPVAGLFGLAFLNHDGPLGDPRVRRALAMAVDRDTLLDDLGTPNPKPQTSLVPTGIDELPQPAVPDWSSLPLDQRRAQAAQAIAQASAGGPLTIKILIPDRPGYRLLLAHLKRDWSAIGVNLQRAEQGEPADLRLIDAVAPISQAAWYLRQFGCTLSAICVPQADALLDSARTAQTALDRQQALAEADTLLTAATPFIPIGPPVRWVLVSQRLTGFQPNPFAQHFPGTLVAVQR